MLFGVYQYFVFSTIGCTDDANKLEVLYLEAEQWIRRHTGTALPDFNNYDQLAERIFDSITSHNLVGIKLTVGKIINSIGFDKIEDELFRHLVLHRLVYPQIKLKTTEYLYRYEQKLYSEDEIYRYMDKRYIAVRRG